LKNQAFIADLAHNLAISQLPSVHTKITWIARAISLPRRYKRWPRAPASSAAETSFKLPAPLQKTISVT